MKASFILLIISIQIALIASANEGDWPGRYFPDVGLNSKPLEAQGHRIAMGVPNSDCDDAKHNIEIDYNGDETYYTCYENRRLYLPNLEMHPLIENERIPPAYDAPHFCLNETISYCSPLPSFGAHRPLWPKYGEYKYVPVQRWLHSLEHGAVVMLYHPCANRNEVKLLKNVVRNCLFRHIISPNQNLTPERPLVLLTWGYRLQMSKFDFNLAVKFIKKHAGRGAEHKLDDGQYDFDLLKAAERSFNELDDDYCSKFDV